MTKQITLEEALKLVRFHHITDLGWRVHDVKDFVRGNVYGGVNGGVNGDVKGDVYGDVKGDVVGNVHGKINGRKWKFVETPKDKLQRLIEESGNQELIDTFNRLEEN